MEFSEEGLKHVQMLTSSEL